MKPFQGRKEGKVRQGEGKGSRVAGGKGGDRIGDRIISSRNNRVRKTNIIYSYISRPSLIRCLIFKNIQGNNRFQRS